jgi:hypothetical protein
MPSLVLLCHVDGSDSGVGIDRDSVCTHLLAPGSNGEMRWIENYWTGLSYCINATFNTDMASSGGVAMHNTYIGITIDRDLRNIYHISFSTIVCAGEHNSTNSLFC